MQQLRGDRVASKHSRTETAAPGLAGKLRSLGARREGSEELSSDLRKAARVLDPCCFRPEEPGMGTLEGPEGPAPEAEPGIPRAPQPSSTTQAGGPAAGTLSLPR